MVAEIALVLWIFVSVAMFATLPPLRAFVLTYVVGYLVLPVDVYGEAGRGAIELSATAHLDKITACHIGALVGTVIFAPELLKRYRFDVFDAAFLVVCAGTYLSAVLAGTGSKDGAVNAVTALRIFGPLLVLTKMHVQSMDDIYACLRAYLGGAVAYSLVAVVEFRLSPQIHRNVYGYFQHDFIQFARYDHFRPVGMLRHAIELSFYMASAGVAAVWLAWRKLLPPLWGWLPAWAVAGMICTGLAATLTFSGYAAFVTGMGVMGLLAWTERRRWPLLVLPTFAVVWMAGRYTGVLEGNYLLTAATWLEAARGDSLKYRMDAEEIYLRYARQHMAFGMGTSTGLIVDQYGKLVKAVDAWWLITATYQGLVGLAGWTVVWSGGIVASMLAWLRLPARFRDVAGLIAVMLGMQLVDFLFNAFPSYFLLILSVGMVSLWHRVRVAKAEPAARLMPMMGVQGA